MSKIYGKENFVLYAQAEANCILETMEVLNNMLMSKELKSFDGKVINVKLERILKEIKRGLNFNFSEYGNEEFRITYYCENRSVPQGNCGCVYAQYYDNTTIYCDSKITKTDKTFKWEIVREQIEKTLKSLERAMEKLQNDIESIDSMMAEYEMIKKSVREYNDKLSILTRDFIGLPSIY